jgi:hypothetical protein
MNRVNLTGFCCQSERSWRNMEKSCGLAEVQPRLDHVIGGLVDSDAVNTAETDQTRMMTMIAERSLRVLGTQSVGA